jgi:hypothetical protein
MRSFVTEPRASQLVGVIEIESLSGIPAIDGADLDDATLALLFDRLARETAESAAEVAAPVRPAHCASEPVARVTANGHRLIHELEVAARRWQRIASRR